MWHGEARAEVKMCHTMLSRASSYSKRYFFSFWFELSNVLGTGHDGGVSYTESQEVLSRRENHFSTVVAAH